MLGFAVVSPHVATIWLDWSNWDICIPSNVSLVADLEKAEKRAARHMPPRKVLLAVAGVPLLKMIQANPETQKIADKMTVAVFDTVSNLNEAGVQVSDERLVGLSAKQITALGFSATEFQKIIMDAASAVTSVASFSASKAPDGDMEASVAVTTPVTGRVELATTSSKLKKVLQPLLAKIGDDVARTEAGQAVARRIKGTISKEDWQKAATKIQESGLPYDLLKLSLASLKDSGVLDAVKAAAKDAGADLDYLEELDPSE